jgi:hypothetical protein
MSRACNTHGMKDIKKESRKIEIDGDEKKR